MSEILHESDFINVDIKSMINKYRNGNNSAAHDEVAATQETKNTSQEKAQTTNTKWETELAIRLNKNKKLGQDARESDVAIELKFFNDFYTAVWGKSLAKNLMQIGEPLRTIFKKMVFDKDVSLVSNPIYNFLNLDYVKKELLATNLINVNTFKGIFNAYAKNLLIYDNLNKVVAHDIIYCRDLYKNSAEDIKSYLNVQHDILSAKKKPSNGESIETVNRKIFLEVPTVDYNDLDISKVNNIIGELTLDKIPSTIDTEAKLNSIAVINSLKSMLGPSIEHKVGEVENNKKSNKTDSPIQKHLGPEGRKDFVDTLNSPAEILAAIQHFSLVSNSDTARKAMLDPIFKSISTEELIQASLRLPKEVTSARLMNKDASALVAMLMDKIRKL